MAQTEGSKTRNRPEGKEGAGAHQQGRGSEQAGQTNRRAQQDDQKHERTMRQADNRGDDDKARGGDTGRRSENDHQKTVQGKNQQGPDDKIGRDVGRGNEGSKGQNIDSRRHQDEHTGKKERDSEADDDRGNR